MKNLIYTAFLAFFTPLILCAQASFQVIAPPTVMAPPDQIDTPADGHVKNLTGAMLDLKWERIIINLPTGMRSQICDPNLCWLPQVSSKTFSLDANQTGDMIVHFLNDVAQPFDAIVHLKVTNLNNLNETATGVYTYSSNTSGTHDQLPAANVTVYPNPVAHHFSLENAEAVHAINMYAIDGRLVARFNAASDNTYTLDGQAAGLYILGLEDKNGRTFQAIELHKN